MRITGTRTPEFGVSMFNYKENYYVSVEVKGKELVITRVPSIEETLEWMKLRRRRSKASYVILPK